MKKSFSLVLAALLPLTTGYEENVLATYQRERRVLRMLWNATWLNETELDLQDNRTQQQEDGALPSYCNSTRIGCDDRGFVEAVELSKANMHGPLPYEISQLAHLRRFRVDHNAITGSIPSAIAQLTQLHYLHLGSNALQGFMPDFSTFPTTLRRLILDHNAFQGTFPESICHLKSLITLDLSGNTKLRGHLPSCLGSMVNLTRFRITDIALTGTIPSQLCQSQEYACDSIGCAAGFYQRHKGRQTHPEFPCEECKAPSNVIASTTCRWQDTSMVTPVAAPIETSFIPTPGPSIPDLTASPSQSGYLSTTSPSDSERPDIPTMTPSTSLSVSISPSNSQSMRSHPPSNIPSTLIPSIALTASPSDPGSRPIDSIETSSSEGERLATDKPTDEATGSLFEIPQVAPTTPPSEITPPFASSIRSGTQNQGSSKEKNESVRGRGAMIATLLACCGLAVIGAVCVRKASKNQEGPLTLEAQEQAPEFSVEDTTPIPPSDLGLVGNVSEDTDTTPAVADVSEDTDKTSAIAKDLAILEAAIISNRIPSILKQSSKYGDDSTQVSKTSSERRVRFNIPERLSWSTSTSSSENDDEKSNSMETWASWIMNPLTNEEVNKVNSALVDMIPTPSFDSCSNSAAPLLEDKDEGGYPYYSSSQGMLDGDEESAIIEPVLGIQGRKALEQHQQQADIFFHRGQRSILDDDRYSQDCDGKEEEGLDLMEI